MTKKEIKTQQIIGLILIAIGVLTFPVYMDVCVLIMLILFGISPWMGEKC